MGFSAPAHSPQRSGFSHLADARVQPESRGSRDESHGNATRSGGRQTDGGGGEGGVCALRNYAAVGAITEERFGFILGRISDQMWKLADGCWGNFKTLCQAEVRGPFAAHDGFVGDRWDNI